MKPRLKMSKDDDYDEILSDNDEECEKDDEILSDNDEEVDDIDSHIQVEDLLSDDESSFVGPVISSNLITTTLLIDDKTTATSNPPLSSPHQEKIQQQLVDDKEPRDDQERDLEIAIYASLKEQKYKNTLENDNKILSAEEATHKRNFKDLEIFSQKLRSTSIEKSMSIARESQRIQAEKWNQSIPLFKHGFVLIEQICRQFIVVYKNNMTTARDILPILRLASTCKMLYRLRADILKTLMQRLVVAPCRSINESFCCPEEMRVTELKLVIRLKPDDLSTYKKVYRYMLLPCKRKVCICDSLGFAEFFQKYLSPFMYRHNQGWPHEFPRQQLRPILFDSLAYMKSLSKTIGVELVEQDPYTHPFFEHDYVKIQIGIYTTTANETVKYNLNTLSGKIKAAVNYVFR